MKNKIKTYSLIDCEKFQGFVGSVYGPWTIREILGKQNGVIGNHVWVIAADSLGNMKRFKLTELRNLKTKIPAATKLSKTELENKIDEIDSLKDELKIEKLNKDKAVRRIRYIRNRIVLLNDLIKKSKKLK